MFFYNPWLKLVQKVKASVLAKIALVRELAWMGNLSKSLNLPIGTHTFSCLSLNSQFLTVQKIQAISTQLAYNFQYFCQHFLGHSSKAHISHSRNNQRMGPSGMVSPFILVIFCQRNLSDHFSVKYAKRKSEVTSKTPKTPTSLRTRPYK